jgi:hypothetical protein
LSKTEIRAAFCVELHTKKALVAFDSGRGPSARGKIENECTWAQRPKTPTRSTAHRACPVAQIASPPLKRIRGQVTIDKMQCGFIPEKGTTDGIFIVRQLQEKQHEQKKNLLYAFIDLEKAFDRVS